MCVKYGVAVSTPASRRLLGSVAPSRARLGLSTQRLLGNLRLHCHRTAVRGGEGGVEAGGGGGGWVGGWAQTHAVVSVRFGSTRLGPFLLLRETKRTAECKRALQPSHHPGRGTEGW